MKKQRTNRPHLSDELERPMDRLDFDNAEQEVRELLEQEKLPTASELEKYNQIVPNGAERILNIIEDEKIHRRELELKELKYRSVFNNLRVIFGFVFGFFFLVFINVGSGGVGYLMVWAAMIVVLVMIFAPFIKTRLGGKD